MSHDKTRENTGDEKGEDDEDGVGGEKARNRCSRSSLKQETLRPLSRGTVPGPASSDALTGPDPCRRLFLFLSPIQGRSSLSLPGEDQLL